MDDETKDKMKNGGKHLWHGVEDAADVIGHGAVGAVTGVADGVETASEATKTRNTDSD
jgi:hypothetical protein